ncbi:MAG: hypothetical protein WKG07_39245 [Hymenobacter sp.]
MYPAHGPGSPLRQNHQPRPRQHHRQGAGHQLRPATHVGGRSLSQVLLADQPFVPKYFGHDVQLNKLGAPSFEDSVRSVPRLAARRRARAGRATDRHAAGRASSAPATCPAPST